MANSNNESNSPAADTTNRPRRGSITSQTFNNLFGRSNSTSGGPTPVFPGPITTAAAQDQRRRMSIATLGLSGTSPTQSSPFTFGGRRGSVSTAGSDSIDENAIDDDEPARSNPTTPFARRMSFGAQALRSARGGGSPGSAAEGGFNWGDQFRSRAESAVSQNQRPSFSSPSFAKANSAHERTKSVSEMSAPPATVAPAPKPAPRKPDAFQERILKGDFYMD